MDTNKKPFRAAKPRPTHCKRGHEFTPENTRVMPPAKGSKLGTEMWACKTCMREANRRKHHATIQTPEGRERYNAGQAARKLGISVEKALEIRARGKCDICGGSEQIKGRTLAIDHCHVTGETRGLLCSHCNRALGLLKDSTEVLQKAINYLNEQEGS